MNYQVASAISKYYIVFAVILIALAGIGGFWLYQNSQTELATRNVKQTAYIYEGGFQHSAEVTEPNELWQVGAILNNRPAYFLSITPELETNFRFNLYQASAVQADARVDTELVISTVRDQMEYWKETRYLEGDVFSLQERSSTLNITLNLPQIKERIENIQENIGYRGGSTNVKLISTVEIDGRIEGNDVEISETYEMPLNLGETIVTLSPNISRTQEVTETITREVEVKPTLFERLYPSILLAASLIALGFVTLEKRRINESELTLLKKQQELNEFKEWISRGKLPEIDSKTTVKMNSLEDLVDTSVDMNRRVIYDEERNIHFFIHENYLYTYEPEEY